MLFSDDGDGDSSSAAIETQFKGMVSEMMLAFISMGQYHSSNINFCLQYPLHIACWKGHSEAVQLLLQADKHKKIIKEKVSMAKYLKFDDEEGYIQFDKSMAIIADLPQKSLRNSLIMDDEDITHGEMRALHIAILTKSDSKVTKLLIQEELKLNREHEEQDEFYNEEDKWNIMKLKDSAGRTPLTIACMQNADVEIIRQLLMLDITKHSVLVQDRFGNTALHYVCDKKNASLDIVNMLLDAEDEFLQSEHTSVLYYNIPRATEMVNKNHGTPLRLAVKAGVSIAVLSKLLEPDRINLDDLGEHVINLLSKKVKEHEDLQHLIIHRIAERFPCALLMFSLIGKTLMFTLWILATEGLIQSSNKKEPFNIFENYKFHMVVFITFILMEIANELHELAQHKVQYFTRKLQIFDLSRIILLVFGVRIFIDEMFKPGTCGRELGTCGRELNNNQNNVLHLAGFLLGLDLIFSLRATFLPFAKFSGALFVILEKLIPFFIVSSIFLISFTFGFRVVSWNHDCVEDECSEMEDACKGSFSECFYHVMGNFFKAGAEETGGIMEVVFGLFIILVVLTIAIAIVSDGWNEVENEAAEFYWESRISFLADIQGPSTYFKDNQSGLFGTIISKTFGRIANKVDAFGYVEIFGRKQMFSWSKDPPYNQVSEIDQYYHPNDYFHPDDAAKIIATHSLHSELYWINNTTKSPLEERMKMMKATFQWLCYGICYFVLLVLGLVTGGFFWPQGFRRSVLSYGYTGVAASLSTTDMFEKLLQSIKSEKSKKSECLGKLVELEKKLSDLKLTIEREGMKELDQFQNAIEW